MRGWVEQCQDIRRSIQEARQKEADKQPLLTYRGSLRNGLVDELHRLNRERTVVGEELAPILTYAEQFLAQLKGVQDQRTILQKNQRRLSTEAHTARTSFEDSKKEVGVRRKEWLSALAGFGLPEDAETRRTYVKRKLSSKARNGNCLPCASWINAIPTMVC